MKKVKQRFNEVKGTLKNLSSKIDSITSSIQESRLENFKVWNIIGTDSLWPHVNNGTYEGEIKYLKNLLTNRVSWIYDNL